jgi:hypothetical protein
MYDSRDDRPVINKSHRAGHAHRLDCTEPGKGDWINYGTPKARRLATKRAEREAIAEGFAEYEAELQARPVLTWREHRAVDAVLAHIESIDLRPAYA